MKQLLKLFLFATLIVLANHAKAQDKMLVRGKSDTLLIKVIEIGVNEIRYRTWPVDQSMPVMVERKDNIRRIILENGTIMKFSADEFSNAANYANQKKMAIKWDMFATTRKVISLSYEYSIKPGMSVEGGLGYIGIGSYTSEFFDFTEADGGFMRLGVKFINTPSYYMQGMRYSHILKGGYIKPELMLLYQENYGYNSGYFLYSGTNQGNSLIKVKGISGFLNFGKQWVFNDVFCVDFFLGLGIGTKKYEAYYNGTQVSSMPNYYSDPIFPATGGFGFLSLSQENGGVHLTTQAGLKLGILIGANGN